MKFCSLLWIDNCILWKYCIRSTIHSELKSSEWIVLLIVHMYLRDSFYHIRMRIKYLVTFLISTKNTDTNTFYCQNKWRTVLCQEWLESPVLRHTVDYQCSRFHYTCGRRGGLMVSALLSRSSGLYMCSSHGRGHCVVFLGKTLNSHRASLHPGATCTFFSSVFKLNFNRIFKYIFNLVSNTRPHKHVSCFKHWSCLNKGFYLLMLGANPAMD